MHDPKKIVSAGASDFKENSERTGNILFDQRLLWVCSKRKAKALGKENPEILVQSRTLLAKLRIKKGGLTHVAVYLIGH